MAELDHADSARVTEILKKTYSERRNWIVNGCEIKEIMAKFKVLITYPDEVSMDLMRFNCCSPSQPVLELVFLAVNITGFSG